MLPLSLDRYADDQLMRGRAYFSREEALQALGVSPEALTAAVTRLIAKKRLANPRHGFYLILRPEDWTIGAPDPARWIDPLMECQRLDYRISLLTSAALHGSSHQAAMVFQVVAPRQLRPIIMGRVRVQFIYQAPAIFTKTNRPEWLTQWKTETGYAKAAGVELTLLDCVRYMKQATGVSGVAQIVRDLGYAANPKKLSKAAEHYENASIRRLGYLLEFTGHMRQAKAIEPFVARAKSAVPLSPSVKHLIESLGNISERNERWMLIVNDVVEIDF